MIWSSLFYLPANGGARPSSAIEVPYGPATVSAVMATAFGVGVMVMVFRLLAGAATALAGGLLLGLGTANWSVSADGPWNHGPTLFLLALGILAAAKERHLWSGLSFAAAITVRPHVAVAPLAIGIAAGWRTRRWKPTVVVGLSSLAGLAIVVWFYQHFFGTPTIRPEQASSFVTGDVNLTDLNWGMNTLFWFLHPTRGLFWYSPFLVLLVPGLRKAWAVAPTWVRASALSAAMYAVIQTRADVWHAGGGFFGYRGPLESLTLAAPLLILSYTHYVAIRPRLRTFFIAASIASVALFALGSSVYMDLVEGDRRCNIQHHVGTYRPSSEQLAARRDAALRC